jgi:adenylosuccinate lyase
MTNVIDKLIVYPENMQSNLDKLGGLIHSQRVLLELTQKGMTREESYAAVQRNAMPVWLEGKDFRNLLKADSAIEKYLSHNEIDDLFEMSFHMKHIDTIFLRVFGE